MSSVGQAAGVWLNLSRSFVIWRCGVRASRLARLRGIDLGVMGSGSQQPATDHGAVRWIAEIVEMEIPFLMERLQIGASMRSPKGQTVGTRLSVVRQWIWRVRSEVAAMASVFSYVTAPGRHLLYPDVKATSRSRLCLWACWRWKGASQGRQA